MTAAPVRTIVIWKPWRMQDNLFRLENANRGEGSFCKVGSGIWLSKQEMYTDSHYFEIKAVLQSYRNSKHIAPYNRMNKNMPKCFASY